MHIRAETVNLFNVLQWSEWGCRLCRGFTCETWVTSDGAINLLPIELRKGVVDWGSPVPLQRPHKNGAVRWMRFQLFLVMPLIRFFHGCSVLKMVILDGFWYTFILCALYNADVTWNGRYLPGRNGQPVLLSKIMLLVWLAWSVDLQFLARAYWSSVKAVKSQDAQGALTDHQRGAPFSVACASSSSRHRSNSRSGSGQLYLSCCSRCQ